MKAPFLARKSHKWIALVAGIQALLWMISGAYMVTIDLDFIHGDPLVRNLEEPLPADLTGLYPVSEVLARFPDAVQVDTVSQRREPRYIVRGANDVSLLDARNGALLSPLGAEDAAALAEHYYTGEGAVGSPVLLSDDAEKPSEIQARPLPLWQVPFDDGIDTTFYVSPASGELITRRHTFWRLFDFLWMLHIMDYEERADFNNNLLRVSALIGTGMTLSGLWLLVYAYRRRQGGGPADGDVHSKQDSNDDLVPKTS